jgi:hypothetical protein
MARIAVEMGGVIVNCVKKQFAFHQRLASSKLYNLQAFKGKLILLMLTII